MDRRQFLAGIAAASLAPAIAKAVPLPEGWIWEGDTLVLRNAEIEIHERIVLPRAARLLIENCKITCVGRDAGFDMTAGETAEIRNCYLVSEVDWPGPEFSFDPMAPETTSSLVTSSGVWM